ncbi:MAG: hypothetical protein JXB17_00125 [Bacteroidales bacterium]|nr:hypothetical protein [Bacteroidales bacterium]
MKRLKRAFIFFIFIISTLISISQNTKENLVDTYSFFLGSKFSLELYPKDSINFDYRIINYEPFEEIIELFEADSIFSDTIINGSIEFIFCIGKTGTGEKDADYKTVLKIRNNTEYPLKYFADIKIWNTDSFTNTNVVDLLPNVKTTEFWPYKIDLIGLYGFKRIIDK